MNQRRRTWINLKPFFFFMGCYKNAWYNTSKMEYDVFLIGNPSYLGLVISQFSNNTNNDLFF